MAAFAPRFVEKEQSGGASGVFEKPVRTAVGGGVGKVGRRRSDAVLAYVFEPFGGYERCGVRAQKLILEKAGIGVLAVGRGFGFVKVILGQALDLRARAAGGLEQVPYGGASAAVGSQRQNGREVRETLLDQGRVGGAPQSRRVREYW